MTENEFRVQVLQLLDVIANATRRTAEACERAEAWAPREELPSPLSALDECAEPIAPAGDPTPVQRVVASRRRRGKGGQGA